MSGGADCACPECAAIYGARDGTRECGACGFIGEFIEAPAAELPSSACPLDLCMPRCGPCVHSYPEWAAGSNDAPAQNA